jgi:hypothetical protein
VHWLEFLIVVSLQEWLEADTPQPPQGAPPEHITAAVAASMGLSTLPSAAGKGGTASGSSSSTSALTQAGVVVVV